MDDFYITGIKLIIEKKKMIGRPKDYMGLMKMSRQIISEKEFLKAVDL